MINVQHAQLERFVDLANYPFEPNWHVWNGFRMHYIDVGPVDGQPILLVHGEPTWSYLYAEIIPPLVAAGFRCIAPDLIGFGKSDKVVDDDWYCLDRHTESVAHLIDALDLSGIILVCQDWGGPIGLRQAVDKSDRFSCLFIMNTWLHHDRMDYTDGVRNWREAAIDPARLGGDMPVSAIVCMALARPPADAAMIERAYDAPFPNEQSKAGARRFPWCLPFAEPVAGNAADQQRCFDALCGWKQTPVHLIFGDADPIFPFEWGRRWASLIPNATIDRVAGAGHFLQQDAPEEVSNLILKHLDCL